MAMIIIAVPIVSEACHFVGRNSGPLGRWWLLQQPRAIYDGAKVRAQTELGGTKLGPRWLREFPVLAA